MHMYVRTCGYCLWVCVAGKDGGEEFVRCIRCSMRLLDSMPDDIAKQLVREGGREGRTDGRTDGRREGRREREGGREGRGGEGRGGRDLISSHSPVMESQGLYSEYRIVHHFSKSFLLECECMDRGGLLIEVDGGLGLY